MLYAPRHGPTDPFPVDPTMKLLLLPTALAATAGLSIAQATIDAELLLPTHLIGAPSFSLSDTACQPSAVSAGRWAQVSPLHQQMLVAFANQLRGQRADAHDPLPHTCWANPQPDAAMALFNAVMQGPTQFNPITRWSGTATQPGGLNLGDPTTLTYSFVPDGTTVPAANGAPTGPSTLFATFNGAFPNQATWQDRVHDAFAQWGQLTGCTYVFEPNDDGVTLNSSNPGVLGVRGDVRIAAKPIDGPSNILAYNAFPNNGDMVLDTGDIGTYSNPSNNYRRLFNIIAHEHGHGLGIAHVCPIQQTKLMEPFLATSFAGPQFDDILTAQRLYGDPLEPDEGAALATDLGTLANGTDTTTLVSIDGNFDQDWYRFTITSPKEVEITVRPAGAPYLEGDQNPDGSCQPGVILDPRALRDLGVSLLATNAFTVLASADTLPAGGTEVISPVLLSAPGTYYVRVFGGGIDNVQLYELDVTIDDAPSFTIDVLGGAPTTTAPDAPTPIDVRVTPGLATEDPASGQLFAAIDGGPFTATPLSAIGSGDYRGLLPAASCFETIRWYVTFDQLGTGTTQTLPLGAPGATFATEAVGTLTTFFSDDFETDTGWTVIDEPTLTDGTWDRGTPVGGGDRGDPASDADGSGQCYLTDNVDGNSDVDGGPTRLLSPVFDLSAFDDARISYSFWYTNDFGANPNQDLWFVQVTNNGGVTWTTVDATTASTSDWTTRSLRLTDFVAPTNNVQMRFTAQDSDPGSVVEAGVDAFRIEVCTPSATAVLPGACPGPFTQSTIGVSAPPTEGTTFDFECTVVSQLTEPVFLGYVIGFVQVNAPLPSCGCIVQPSLDVLELGVGSWTSDTLQTWTLPLSLPLGTAGAELYVQGLVAGSFSNTCTEIGLFLNLTDGLRVTVQ